MLRCEEYVRAETLDAALELGSQADAQYITGGTLGRLYERRCRLLVDILHLLEDEIRVDEGELLLGAGCTLRRLETSALVSDQGLGILGQSVRHLGGIALRNMITLGGTVASRLGSSELITVLVALRASVVLHGVGKISLSEYLKAGYKQQIISRLSIPLHTRECSLVSMRNSFTDMSLIHVAVVRDESGLQIVAGARPGRAAVAEQAWKLYQQNDLIRREELVAASSEGLSFGSDLRADAWYRKKVFPVLLERALKEVGV